MISVARVRFKRLGGAKMKPRIVILTNRGQRLSDLTATLKRAGCELQEAESLKAAKTLILQSRPNLLVIDERVDDLGCL